MKSSEEAVGETDLAVHGGPPMGVSHSKARRGQGRDPRS